jgi:hypothetical protein
MKLRRISSRVKIIERIESERQTRTARRAYTRKPDELGAKIIYGACRY